MGIFKWLLNIVLGWFGLVNKKKIEEDSKAAAEKRRAESSVEAKEDADDIADVGKKAREKVEALKPEEDDVFNADDFNKKD